MAAMSEARRRKLARMASHVAELTGKPVALEPPKVEPKGDIAKAHAAYVHTFAALTDEEKAIFSRWEAEGPPRIPRTEVSDDSHEVAKLATTNTVAQTETHEHLGEWVKGPNVKDRHEVLAIDYSEFGGTRRAQVQEAWDARALYFALSTDKETYKLYWPNRGGCRENGMGELRDEIASLRSPKAPDGSARKRTADENEYLAKLERALLIAEDEHERPLRAACANAGRRSRKREDAYNDPSVCPHCRGTSVLRPSFDAPRGVVDEWIAVAEARSEQRFFRMEALRRSKLNHNLDLSRTNAMGHVVSETWAEFRKRVISPITVGGTKGPTVKTGTPDQGGKWLSQA